MKKVMMTVMLLITATMMAQRGPHRDNPMEAFSTKEKATLATKKMTLVLALDASQSQKLYAIMLKEIEDREAHKKTRKGSRDKPSSDERYKKMSDRLDKRIAMQREVKSILTEEQFEKWQRHHLGKKRSKKGNNSRRD